MQRLIVEYLNVSLCCDVFSFYNSVGAVDVETIKKILADNKQVTNVTDGFD